MKPGWKMVKFGEVVKNANLVEREPEARDKDTEEIHTIFKYALHDARKPISVATYEIMTLPKELKRLLPQPKAIAALLQRIEK